MNVICSVEDLTISFGNNHVLRNLNFELYENEVLGIIGPNGAGKTVLLNILTGILRPTSGKVVFCGKDVTKTKVVERSKMGFGRTFQVPRSFENMTVYENVMVGAVYVQGKSEKEAGHIADEIIDMIGMSDKRDLLVRGIGLLDRKRLEIGVALAQDPKILLIDEAAGGLTESEVAKILEIVSTVKAQGVSVIWIEHVLQTMLDGTDRILCLAEGRNVICGLPREVMDSKAVKDVYLGDEDDE